VGDSGSGLTAWNEDIQAYELIGVVSFGIGCNSSFEDTKLPGVYTRVSTAVNWVRGKTSRGTFCPPTPNEPVACPATQPCPAACGWAQWSEFTKCTGTGDIGSKEKSRKCEDNTGVCCGSLWHTVQRACRTRTKAK